MAHHHHHHDPPSCSIAGRVYAENAVNPANICQICNPNTNSGGWTARVGLRCDDRNPRTYNDVCTSAGVCQGTPYTCKQATACAKNSPYDGSGKCKYEYHATTAKCRAPRDACDLPTLCGVRNLDCPPYDPHNAPTPVLNIGSITQPKYTALSDAAVFAWSKAGVSCGDMSYTIAVADPAVGEFIDIVTTPNGVDATRTAQNPGLTGASTGRTTNLPLHGSLPNFGEGDAYIVRITGKNVHGRYLPNAAHELKTTSKTPTIVDLKPPSTGSILHGAQTLDPVSQPVYVSKPVLEARAAGWVDDISGIKRCDVRLLHIPRTKSPLATAGSDPRTVIKTMTAGPTGPAKELKSVFHYDLTSDIKAGRVHNGDRFQWSMTCEDVVGHRSGLAVSSEVLFDASVPKCGTFAVVRPESEKGDFSPAAQLEFVNRNDEIMYRWEECHSEAEAWDPHRQTGMRLYRTRVIDVRSGEEITAWEEAPGPLEIHVGPHAGLLQHGHRYRAELIACSRAGVCTPAQHTVPAAGLLVDLTQPNTPDKYEWHQVNRLYAPDNKGVFSRFTAENRFIDLDWSPLHDPESGILDACVYVFSDGGDFMQRWGDKCLPIANVATAPERSTPPTPAEVTTHLRIDVTQAMGGAPASLMENGMAYRPELRIRNRAGSTRIVYGREMVVDASAPVANPAVVDHVAAGTLREPATQPYVSSFTQFVVSLRGIWDPQSGCRNVDFAVVRSDGLELEAKPTSNFYAYSDQGVGEGAAAAAPITKYTLHFPAPPAYKDESELKPGAGYLRPNVDYRIRATVYNGASISADFYSPAFRADATPPLDFNAFAGYFDELFGQKIMRYTDDIYHVPVYADAAIDNESPIVNYVFEFRDVTDEKDPYAYEAGPLLTMFSLGPNRAATLVFGMGSVPALAHGRTYSVAARATNAAGHQTLSKRHLVTVDLTPPECGRAWFGASEAHEGEARYQRATDRLAVGWADFVDPESGIDHYTFKIAADKDFVTVIEEGKLPLPTPGNPGAFTVKNLQLTVGGFYYVAVRGFNPVGRFCQATSVVPVFIDDVAPEPAPVCGGPAMAVGVCVPRGSSSVGSTDLEYISDNAVARVHWGVFHDTYLPITAHKVCISTKPGGDVCDILGPAVLSGSVFETSAKFPNGPVPDGTVYYATVTASDDAGLVATAHSGSVTVDASAPHWPGIENPTNPATSPVRLVSSAGAPTDHSDAWTTEVGQVYARLTPAAAASPIRRYRACLVRGPHVDDAAAEWPALPAEDTELALTSVDPALGCVSDIVTGQAGTAEATGNVVFGFVESRTMEHRLEPGFRYRVIGTAASAVGHVARFVSAEIVADPAAPVVGWAHTKLAVGDEPATDAQCMAIAKDGDKAGAPVSNPQVDFDHVIYINGVEGATQNKLALRLCGAHGVAGAGLLGSVDVRVRKGIMGADDEYVPALASSIPAEHYLADGPEGEAARSVVLDFTAASDSGAVEPGVFYQPEVTAHSRAGRVTATFPAAVMLVDQAPVPGEGVFVGYPGAHTGAGRGEVFVSTTATVPVFWDPWHNDQGPMRDYAVCLTERDDKPCTGLLAPGDHAKLGMWVPVHGLETTFVFDDPEGIRQSFFARVRGCNQVGLCSEQTSVRVTVSDGKPTAGRVRIEPSDALASRGDATDSAAIVANPARVRVSWAGFRAHGTRTGGSIGEFSVGLGSAPGRDDVLPFRPVGLRTFVTLDVPAEQAAAEEAAEARRETSKLTAPRHGAPLYATVVARDRRGLSIQATTEHAAFWALHAPDVPQAALEVLSDTFDQTTGRRSVAYRASVGTVAEPVAGLARCEIALGTAQGGTQVQVPLAVKTTDCSQGFVEGTVDLPAGASDNVELWLSVYATSAAGHAVARTASDPAYVAAPLPPALATRSFCQVYTPVPSILAFDPETFEPELAWSDRLCETAVPLRTGGRGVIMRAFAPADDRAVITMPLDTAEVEIFNALSGEAVTTSGRLSWEKIVKQTTALAAAGEIARELDQPGAGDPLSEQQPNLGPGFLISDVLTLAVPVPESAREGKVSAFSPALVRTTLTNVAGVSGIRDEAAGTGGAGGTEKRFASAEPIFSTTTTPEPSYFGEYGQFLIEWTVESSFAPLREFAAEIWIRDFFGDGADKLAIGRFPLSGFRARGDEVAVIVAPSPFAAGALRALFDQYERPLDAEYEVYARLFATDEAGHWLTEDSPSAKVNFAGLPRIGVRTGVQLRTGPGEKLDAATPRVGAALEVVVTRDLGQSSMAAAHAVADCRLVVGLGTGAADLLPARMTGDSVAETLSTPPTTAAGVYIATLSCPDGVYVSAPVVVDPAAPVLPAAPAFNPRVTRMPQDILPEKAAETYAKNVRVAAAARAAARAAVADMLPAEMAESYVAAADADAEADAVAEAIAMAGADAEFVEHTVEVAVPAATSGHASVVRYDIELLARVDGAAAPVHHWTLATPAAVAAAIDAHGIVRVHADGVLLAVNTDISVRTTATAATGLQAVVSGGSVAVQATFPRATTAPIAAAELMLDDSFANRRARLTAAESADDARGSGRESVSAALRVSWLAFDPVTRGEYVGAASAMAGGFGAMPLVAAHHVSVECDIGADQSFVTVASGETSLETETTISMPGVAAVAGRRIVTCRAYVSGCTTHEVCERASSGDVRFEMSPTVKGMAIVSH